MEMLFLSEYCGANKTAWVCRRRDLKDYAVVGYVGGLEVCHQVFDTEADAEDWAEDWVQVAPL